MKFLRSFFHKLYIAWVLTVFTVFMIILLPGIILPFVFGQRFGWIGYKFLWLWSWIFSLLNFIRYETYGRENFQKGKAYIFICNHTSYLDIPGLCIAIDGEFKPLAKKELLKIPVFGWIAKSAAVIVDRSSPQSRKKSIDKLKSVLRYGISILIFAEGTQNRSAELLQPFHDGAFRIAIDAQQPILPMVIIGAGKLMPPGKADVNAGKIKIVIGKEISTAGLNGHDIPSLKQRTFDAMMALIVQNAFEPT